MLPRAPHSVEEDQMGLLSKLKSKGSTLLFGELIAEAGSVSLEEDSDYKLTLSIRQRANAAPHLQLKFGDSSRSSHYEITRMKESIPYFESASETLRQLAVRSSPPLSRTESSPSWLKSPFRRLKEELFGVVMVDFGALEMDDQGRKLRLSFRRFPKRGNFLYIQITSVGDTLGVQTSEFVPLARLFSNAVPLLRRHTV